MRKALIPLAALALTGLAACGPKAKNEAAEANETTGGDSNTMGEAVSDVNAAQAAAFTDAENAYAGNASQAGGDGNEIVD
jgi:hypothetical protein